MTVFHRRRNDSNGSGCAGHQNSSFLIFKIFPLKENERDRPLTTACLSFSIFSCLIFSYLVLSYIARRWKWCSVVRGRARFPPWDRLHRDIRREAEGEERWDDGQERGHHAVL